MSGASSPTLSAVVPIFNSEETLRSLIDRLTPVLAGRSPDYEILLVNDGSRDASWSLVKELAEADPHVRGIEMMRNYGQHNALLAGIRAAKFDAIITLDDDLQNPPDEIPKLLDKLAEGFDVVYGWPEKERHGLLRDVASVMTKKVLQKTMGADTARHVSAFRAFRTSLREAFSTYQSSFVSIDVLLTWATSRFAAIPVRHDSRSAGKSNYTMGKLLAHAMNMMTGFSTWPLRLASLMGFAFTFFGVLVLVYVVGRYIIEGESVPGFPFLASIIAIFSGAQMFALGIMGEYMARMHYRLMERPPYAVRSRTFKG